MKKTLSIILAVMLLLGVTASIYAEATYTGGVDALIQIQSVAPAGPGATAQQLSSVIVAGNRILGFSYTDTAAGTIGLWDSAAIGSGCSATTRIGELSVAAGTAEELMYPFPKKLDRGLVYSSTTATGNLTIFYE